MLNFTRPAGRELMKIQLGHSPEEVGDVLLSELRDLLARRTPRRLTLLHVCTAFGAVCVLILAISRASRLKTSTISTLGPEVRTTARSRRPRRCSPGLRCSCFDL